MLVKLEPNNKQKKPHNIGCVSVYLAILGHACEPDLSSSNTFRQERPHYLVDTGEWERCGHRNLELGATHDPNFAEG